MPNLIIPIPHTYDAVTRRVAKSIVNGVQKITSMDERVRVEIMGESQKAAQPGTELGDKPQFNRLQHAGKVMVSFRETYVESEAINSIVRQPYNQPIFEDRDIGIIIKPVYSYTDMELNFVYRAKSKQEAIVWRDDIRVRMADHRESHLHQVEYHFPVPNFCSLLLMHLFELRENVAGYGDTLGDYLKRHYTKRATVLTNQNGDDSNTLLVIAEKQMGVQGWFDFDFPVEEEKNEEGPSYLVAFAYRFSFYKPVELNVVYPQIVHNQLISEDFLVKAPDIEDPLSMPTYKDEYRLSLDSFDYEARRQPRPVGGVSIPDYDEWVPHTTLPHTASLINWMVVFSPEDLHLVFTEEDVLDTGFKPEILEFMRRAGDDLLKLGHCALHIGLFRDKDPVEDGALSFHLTDRAFELRTTSPADLRQTYHLRLSFCTNVHKYTEEALENLSNDPCASLLLFQTMENRLDVEDAWKRCGGNEGGTLDRGYIKDFFDHLNNESSNKAGDRWMKDTGSFRNGMDSFHVMYLTILANKRNNED